MSYMALYRKWRPDTFEEVKGQDPIVTTLRNQLTHDRIGHAYLFCGTRGTGKTTVAKLFARAVNCEHPVNGSPCGQCASCRAILDGSSMNVIEIDAASNNGVDNIREIREEVQYSPTQGNYKVYIIDEVHMLSGGAFNALLKTLEEPPSYVIFILATTEVHKIPITVLSRCQRYDFRRISIDTISGRLAELMEREGQQADRKALDYIARAADGSMRDALSLLDRCIAFYLGETLTYEKCLEVLGAVDTEVFIRLMEAVKARDVTAAIGLIDEIVWQGRELGQFITDFTWFMRNLLLLKISEDSMSKLDFSRETLKRMKQTADGVDMEPLMRYIRIFSELSGKIRYASQKRVVLELAVIKLCVPEMEQNYDSILQRISELSAKVDACMTQERHDAAPVRQTEPEKAEAPQEETLEQLKQTLPEATLEELQEIAKRRSEVYARLEPALANLLRMSDVRMNKERKSIVVILDEKNQGVLNNEADRQTIEEAFCSVLNRRVPVEYRKRTAAQTDLISMELFEARNIPVEYDDN